MRDYRVINPLASSLTSGVSRAGILRAQRHNARFCMLCDEDRRNFLQAMQVVPFLVWRIRGVVSLMRELIQGSTGLNLLCYN
jgi:hypothetical protein